MQCDKGSRARKQKRTVKQLLVDLMTLGFDGSCGRVAIVFGKAHEEACGRLFLAVGA